MNKIYILLLIIPILIIGCKTKKLNVNISTQSIESLNMNLFSKDGKKLLTIKSPYSRFNNDNNTFKLRKTTIDLYKNNETLYTISADNSQLSNNNKLIELNGNVLIKNLSQIQDKLSANSFIWNIYDLEYTLVGDVNFETDSITLSSNKAILNNKTNLIEFFNPVKYKIKEINSERVYEINSENAYYDIVSKSVIFSSKEDRVRSTIYF